MADLDLEKGSTYAARRMFLAADDTSTTLACREEVVARGDMCSARRVGRR